MLNSLCWLLGHYVQLAMLTWNDPDVLLRLEEYPLIQMPIDIPWCRCLLISLNSDACWYPLMQMLVMVLAAKYGRQEWPCRVFWSKFQSGEVRKRYVKAILAKLFVHTPVYEGMNVYVWPLCFLPSPWLYGEGMQVWLWGIIREHKCVKSNLCEILHVWNLTCVD